MAKVSMNYEGHLSLVRLLAEVSGSLEALEWSKGVALNDSQIQAIHRLRAKVLGMLDQLQTFDTEKGSPTPERKP